MKNTIDELLQTPYWVIDILPAQVPKGSPGQYFAVESFFLQEEQLAEIKRRHLRLILKLNCYRDISLDEDGVLNPPPGEIAERINMRYTCVMTGDSMIQSEADDTNLTLFNPDGELLALVRTLAAGEGLYVWQPPEGKKKGEDKDEREE